MFRSRIQQQCESFGSFLTDLKLKAQTCNFATLMDLRVRDQTMFGVEDKKVRKKLFREAELTLDAAIKICHASELSLLHLRMFGNMAVNSANASDGAAVGVISNKGRTDRTTRPAQGLQLQTLQLAAQAKTVPSLRSAILQLPREEALC